MMTAKPLASAAAGLAGFNEKAKLVIYSRGDNELKSGNISDSAKTALSGDPSLGSLTKSLSDQGFHVVQVQFNPSSVRFEANSKPIPAAYLMNNADPTIPNTQTRQESITMTVDLIFDAVSNKDAFHSDKLRLSASDVMADIGTVVKEVRGGYSVQKQTNGLVAAILRESTQVISFVWAKMRFTGIMEEVQAKYTMFSPSGKPIRSTVTLRLKQTMTGAESKDWDKKFTDFFGAPEDVTKMIEGKSKLQELQRFINVRF